jgi:rhamnose utilization protein RhaD (predicted bifunctional aldolase and dehydrogenase)
MEDFIKVSQTLGKNILYVQGAGGNASIKIGDKLYVKASGEKLKNMSETQGYVCCRYKPLAKYFKNKTKYIKQDEYEFLRLVDSSIIPSESYGSPSMEAGFHAVIPSKYVFHLHSAYANILGCMSYGSHTIRNLYKDIPHLIIDYVNPGYELAFVLAKKKSLPSLIFLRNHGIIVHGDDTASCIEIIQKLHTMMEAYLKEQKIFKPFTLLTKFPKIHGYIFPDSAVFSHIDIQHLPERKSKEVLEILSAQEYSIHMMKRLGKIPKYLTQSEINKLLNMKQEKYRQELFKK